MIEIWQEVNCPQHDVDLFGDDLVYAGQEFHCVACGGTHVAAPGLVATYVEINGVQSYPELPASAEELRALAGRPNPHPGGKSSGV
ncbi:MAG: hypothetical protein GX086_13780 [Alcaligenaceae bacterium]|nr:hypothetical protein [Alcaligenaceae bacterium]